MFPFLSALGAIILIDLVLSGDNALVIGTLVSDFLGWRRWLLMFCGGGCAILIRVLLTILAGLLLGIPLIQGIGGCLLLLIAMRLVNRDEENQIMQAPKEQSHSFKYALFMILVADVITSLDNILAIGGVAKGQWSLIIIGLIISVSLMLLGSALIAMVSQRFPWLIDGVAFVLAWTAAQLLLADTQLAKALEMNAFIVEYKQVLVPVFTLITIVITKVVGRKKRSALTKEGE